MALIFFTEKNDVGALANLHMLGYRWVVAHNVMLKRGVHSSRRINNVQMNCLFILLKYDVQITSLDVMFRYDVQAP